MKRLLALSLLLAVAHSSHAQKRFPLQTLTDSVRFRIGIAADHRLRLEWPDGTAPEAAFQKRRDFPDIVAVKLEEADLVVEYTVKNTKHDLLPSLTLSLHTETGETVAPPYFEVNDGQPGATKEVRRFVWLDATERMLEPDATYFLVVHRALMGAVDCLAPRPAFSLNKKLPHYAAAGVGLALLGIGWAHQSQTKTAYASYVSNWETGQLDNNANRSLLEKARKDQRISHWCAYSGLAILGADAIWYWRRRANIRRRARDYDTFCEQAPLSSHLEWRPYWQAAPGGGGAGVAAILSF